MNLADTPGTASNAGDHDASLFAAHRRHVLEALQAGEGLLIFSSPHRVRNADAEYRYRQNSDLYYLTGWEQPEAVVFLRSGSSTPFTLFVQPRDPDREIWTGRRHGPEGALAQFGADAAFPLAELPDRLSELVQGLHTLYYAAGEDPENDQVVLAAIRKARRPAREAFLDLPDAFIHPSRLLHELRLVKSELELERLREAARVTSEAHMAAMRATRPGVGEHELEALVDYTFRRSGGMGPGYTTIVGGGPNACILHYVENGDALSAGQLVLVDAGCEVGFYTADVTRTWPVDGTFSPAQRTLYELVLEAQLAVIDVARAGNPFSLLQETAIRRLTEGMVRVGLLQGDVDALIEEKAYKRYYMHGVSHWLGLDVHDAGKYVRQGASRVLEPGMVVTVEPGLYVGPEDTEAPEAFRGVGIRIEDDVLITEGDPEVLTAACPKTVASIEALMAAAR